jgi:hypothetical protein
MTTTNKIIWTVAGVAVTGITAGVIIKQVNKGKRERQIEKQQRETPAAVSSAIDVILKNNVTLPPDQRQIASYTNAQYKAYADSLFTAMDGIGTDNDVVKSTFQRMNHDLDIMLLVEAFGVRENENLASWLTDDGATTYVNKILETKGRVTFRF